MKDKIYVVTQEWGNTSLEDCNFEILGVFFDLREATLCMQKARNIELSESYGTPYEYLSHSMEVSVNEEDWKVEITATNGKWDNFEIHEKLNSVISLPFSLSMLVRYSMSVSILTR